MYMCVHVYVCVYMYVHLYVSVYVCICVCVYLCVHVYVYLCVSVCMCVCACLSVYACVHVCVCMCIVCASVFIFRSSRYDLPVVFREGRYDEWDDWGGGRGGGPEVMTSVERIFPYMIHIPARPVSWQQGS